MNLSFPHIRPLKMYQYLAGELSPAQGSTIEDHCLSCITCCQRRDTIAWLRYLKKKPVIRKTLSKETQCVLEAALKQYFDGNILPNEERVRIKTHLQSLNCSSCRHLLDIIRLESKGRLYLFDPIDVHPTGGNSRVHDQ